MQMQKTIQHMFKQAENRLLYARELKQKVSENTDPSGVGKINEDIDALMQEFEKLNIEVEVKMRSIDAVRWILYIFLNFWSQYCTPLQKWQEKLCTRVTKLQEIDTVRLNLEEWLEEIEQNIKTEEENELLANELTEKILCYEKFKSFSAEIIQHAEMVSF